MEVKEKSQKSACLEFFPCTFPWYMRKVMPHSNIKSCTIYFKSMHINNHFCKAIIYTFCYHGLALEACTTHRVKHKPDYVIRFPLCSVSLPNTRIYFSAAFMNINCRQTKNSYNFCPKSNLKIQSTMVTESKES